MTSEQRKRALRAVFVRAMKHGDKDHARAVASVFATEHDENILDWPTCERLARAGVTGDDLPQPSSDWICDRGGLHWRGQDCDCPPDDDAQRVTS